MLDLSVCRWQSNRNIENIASLTATISRPHAYAQSGPYRKAENEKIKGTRVHACIACAHAGRGCSPEYASKQAGRGQDVSGPAHRRTDGTIAGAGTCRGSEWAGLAESSHLLVWDGWEVFVFVGWVIWVYFRPSVDLRGLDVYTYVSMYICIDVHLFV
jgi:hypothetical protein